MPKGGRVLSGKECGSFILFKRWKQAVKQLEQFPDRRAAIGALPDAFPDQPIDICQKPRFFYIANTVIKSCVTDVFLPNDIIHISLIPKFPLMNLLKQGSIIFFGFCNF